jgi:hypothetical protein
VTGDAYAVFSSAAAKYCAWVENFDPERTTIDEVVSALGAILDQAPLPVLRQADRPHGLRIFKPNERWQADRRKAARLPLDGYRTSFLPNDDGTADTQCSLAYDIADFYELLTAKSPDADLVNYLNYVSWGYANVRLRSARQALLKPSAVPDPFTPREVGGRFLRFVSWRTSASSHASEDPPDVRGASTLCGGRLAFHKHTQQQWSCYPCSECRAIADGAVYTLK